MTITGRSVTSIVNPLSAWADRKSVTPIVNVYDPETSGVP